MRGVAAWSRSLFRETIARNWTKFMEKVCQYDVTRRLEPPCWWHNLSVSSSTTHVIKLTTIYEVAFVRLEKVIENLKVR